MNFFEQNELLEEVELFLSKKLRGKEFHVLIGFSGDENAMVISTGTLSENTSLKHWRNIAGGVLRAGEELARNLDLPDDANFNKPVEPK